MQEHLSQHTHLVMALFMKHPIIGASLGLTLATMGYFIPTLIDAQIPIIIMQSIQLTVWGLAGVASLLTIIGFIRKNKK